MEFEWVQLRLQSVGRGGGIAKLVEPWVEPLKLFMLIYSSTMYSLNSNLPGSSKSHKGAHNCTIAP